MKRQAARFGLLHQFELVHRVLLFESKLERAMTPEHYIALAALASLLPGLILILLTHKLWPSFATVVMRLLGISVGVIGLLYTIDAVQKGVFAGAPASRYFGSTVRLDESPVTFWLQASFFGVPSFLLVVWGVISIGLAVLGLVRNRSSTD